MKREQREANYRKQNGGQLSPRQQRRLKQKSARDNRREQEMARKVAVPA